MDKTGMQAVHVPYKGGGQAIGDVIAGHVPMTITSVQATKGLVESGKVQGARGHQPGPLARHAGRADHAGGRRAARPTSSCGSGLRSSGRRACRSRSRPSSPQAVAKVMTDPGGARAARQARHHAGRHLRPGACTPSSKARSRTGPASSTPRASRRNSRRQGEVPHPRRARRLSTATPRPWSNGRPVTSMGGIVMLRFIRWCSIAGAAAWPPRARAGARHLSGPADPVRRRLPAGRRDRHVLPPDLERARHRARPIDRDREQGRRRRLHRLAVCRRLAGRRLHGAGGGERASASTRRCSRSTRRASIR